MVAKTFRELTADAAPARARLVPTQLGTGSTEPTRSTLAQFLAMALAADISDASANGRSLITAADYAAMKVLLGLTVGTNVLAFDTYLDALRGATNAVSTFPWRNAGGTAAAHSLAALGDTLLASNTPGTWRNAINSGSSTLTDGTSIATDCSTNNVFQVTLAGTPRTLANPTNVVVGASYNWFIIQDGTGSRPLTLGSNFKLGVDSGGSAITYTPSTAAASVDLISAVARTTSSLATAVMKGIQ